MARKPNNKGTVKKRKGLPARAGIGLCRLFCRLLVLGWRASCRNPLVASGFVLFTFGFGFVAYNAVFSQKESHHGVFFETRPLHNQDVVSHRNEQPVQQPVITQTASQPQRIAPVPVASPSATADNGDLRQMQEKLSRLGFYHGAVDGLDGPQTRAAITAWKKAGMPTEAHVSNKTGQSDSIAALIGDEGHKTVDRVTTNAISDGASSTAKTMSDIPAMQPSVEEKQPVEDHATVRPQDSQQDKGIEEVLDRREDIMRIQTALRAFGYDNIAVNGALDQPTFEALKSFQEMFSLDVTGHANRQVLTKMQDIGLIG